MGAVEELLEKVKSSCGPGFEANRCEGIKKGEAMGYPTWLQAVKYGKRAIGRQGRQQVVFRF